MTVVARNVWLYYDEVGDRHGMSGARIVERQVGNSAALHADRSPIH